MPFKRKIDQGSEVSNDAQACKRKKEVKRLWLPWEFCRLIEPKQGEAPPPFGWKKPSALTDEEKAVIAKESETLFPVGFYDMTPTKRGVTKGRGDWKGKEALRLAHCSAEKNGCRFKVRFCRVPNGMEIHTSGNHDVKAHLTPRKRGLAPAARAIVTKYREESQSQLVEWLKDGGLLDGSENDLEKVKQQIKRRKMTLKRKTKKEGSTSEDEDNMCEEQYAKQHQDEDKDEVLFDDINVNEDLFDPLCSAKINMLHDDSIVSLIDPPTFPGTSTPPDESYDSDEEGFHDDICYGGGNFFGEGPYSPTTVVDEVEPVSSFQPLFEMAPSLHTIDFFPRTSHDCSMFSMPPLESMDREKQSVTPPPTTGLEPDGIYHKTEV